MRDYFRMFGFIKPYLLTYIPGLLMYSSQGFMFSLILSVILSRASAAIMSGSTGMIIQALILLGVLFVLMMVISCAGLYLFNAGVLNSEKDIKKLLFRKYIKNNVEASMSGHSGEGIAALNTDAKQAMGAYERQFWNLMLPVLSIIVSLIVVFSVNYLMGIASVGVGLVTFFAQSRLIKPQGKVHTERLSQNAALVARVSNIFQGGITIRAYNAEDSTLSGFNGVNEIMRGLTFRETFLSTLKNVFSSVQSWLALFTTFALGGWLVSTGRLEFSAMMMVPPMSMTLATAMSDIGGAIAGLQAPAAAAKRVFAVLDAGRDDKIDDKPERAQVTESCRLRVNGLNFAYSGAETNALTDVTLDIKENMYVAFVGPSGCGKSTLLRSIIGMYERDNMDIQAGDAVFTQTSSAEWRRRFAYVDQSCKLFNMSIYDNISLGAWKDATEERIKQSAIRASADGFITALPEGYNYPCGEKGASLSGGQKQRIAIARALCRKAPVLVFDEATSALDTVSEAAIMETINSLRGDHTILITTHNLQHVVNADMIVVMNDGRVTDTGTHQELIGRSEIYAELFERSAGAERLTTTG